MDSIRKNHVSPSIYYHETNKTTKYQKQYFTSSFIGGGSNSHITPSSKPQGGGGGVTPTPPTPTCLEEKTYIVNEVTYELEVEYSATSNDIQISYIEHTVNRDCSETDLEKVEVVTVTFDENDSTDPKTISGTIQFHGNNITYSFEQEGKKETRVVAKFNVDNPNTAIALSFNNGWYDGARNYSDIEIDGVSEHLTRSGNSMVFVFSDAGEHIVKYTLKNPSFIADAAFDSCYALTSVYIPSSVESVGGSAFTNCYNLANVTFADDSMLNIIGKKAFENCRTIANIDIPENVVTIEQDAFYRCSGITYCTFGSSITNINGYAFAGCGSLSSVTFSDVSHLDNIGLMCFAACSGLTTIKIPESITSIGQQAFNSCTHLTSISIYALVPPTLGIIPFNDTNECPIYVPNDSVEAYKSAERWSEYSDRIQPIQ